MTNSSTRLRDATGDARYLAQHVNVIANLEDAGRCYRDIANVIDRIGAMINRPEDPRVLGPCREWVHGSHDRDCTFGHPHVCGVAITAKPGDKQAVCAGCGAHHDIAVLIRRQLAEMDAMSFTAKELHDTVLPLAELDISRKKLQELVARKRLTPTGFDAEGKPRFLLADVRRLYKPTGAAAHKRNRTTTRA